MSGYGTFKATEGCNPFCGAVGELHKEEEVRIETILPAYLKNRVLSALLKAHPYEEPAFDLYSLENSWTSVGSGVIGELPCEYDEADFLQLVKDKFHVGSVRHTEMLGKKVRRVALCGGAGASFAPAAMVAKADVYITGEMRYHDLFNYSGKMLMAVIGHYESEQYTVDIFAELIGEKFPELKVQKSIINTNPINYL